MVRQIILYPDERLQTECRGVKVFDSTLRMLVEDLFQTMYAKDGIGLAAPQVGVLQDIFVMDVRDGKVPCNPIAFVNPFICVQSGLEVDEEQCLSIPKASIAVERATAITVVAQSIDGEVFTREFSGLEARCVAHEVDHLAGVLILDRAKTESLRRQ